MHSLMRSSSFLAVLTTTTGLALGQNMWVTKNPATSPSPRANHALAYDEVRGTILMFGGADRNPPLLGDTWEWDGRNWHQRFPSQSPPARAGHRMVYDRSRQRIVLFGGATGTAWPWIEMNDVWEWDGHNWSQGVTAPMATRLGFSMAYDPLRSQVIVLGGSTAYAYPCNLYYRDDMWAYDGTSWTQLAQGPRTGYGPFFRSGAAMGFDEHRNVLVVAGGWVNNPNQSCIGGRSNAVWEWDGATWTPGSTSGSSPNGPGLSALSTTYDPNSRRLLVFGNDDFPAWNGYFFAYDGTTWAHLAWPWGSTTHRMYGEIAYDQRRARVLKFGGTNEGASAAWNDTRVYGQTVAATATARGAGCAAAGGIPTLAAVGVPDLGNQGFQMATTGGGANGLQLLFLSLGQGNQAFTPNCVARIDTNSVIATLPSFGDSAGTSTTGFPIPGSNALVGVMVYAQAVALHPPGGYLGLAFTNGLDLRIGD